ncbi:MAG: DNA-3-methyladenine glycosylase I [Granulosicoccus sp.]
MNESIPETCQVPANDSLFQRYHDEEWGVPTINDQAIFEKVCLEGFQAGLNWRTVLHKRPALRQSFDDFLPERISRYNDADVRRLMNDDRIIRNRRKILSAINNARHFSSLQREFGSLANFFWSFEPASNSRPTRVTRRWLRENPFTPESTELSKALKKRGWSYVGPTTMYALMQALGLVNDHVDDCPRHASIEILRQKTIRPEQASGGPIGAC